MAKRSKTNGSSSDRSGPEASAGPGGGFISLGGSEARADQNDEDLPFPKVFLWGSQIAAGHARPGIPWELTPPTPEVWAKPQSRPVYPQEKGGSWDVRPRDPGRGRGEHSWNHRGSTPGIPPAASSFSLPRHVCFLIIAESYVTLVLVRETLGSR